MTKPKKLYDTTLDLDPTSYFVTAQPTSTRYFVTGQEKDFATPQTWILINKVTDVTYLRFAGLFWFRLTWLENSNV